MAGSVLLGRVGTDTPAAKVPAYLSPTPSTLTPPVPTTQPVVESAVLPSALPRRYTGVSLPGSSS